MCGSRGQSETIIRMNAMFWQKLHRVVIYLGSPTMLPVISKLLRHLHNLLNVINKSRQRGKSTVKKKRAKLKIPSTCKCWLNNIIAGQNLSHWNKFCFTEIFSSSHFTNWLTKYEATDKFRHVQKPWFMQMKSSTIMWKYANDEKKEVLCHWIWDKVKEDKLDLVHPTEKRHIPLV